MDLRELQEREKALRLQKEKLQRELEEKKKKVQGSQCGVRSGAVLGFGLGSPGLVAPGVGAALLAWPRGGWPGGRGEHVHVVPNPRLAAGPRKSSSASRRSGRRTPRRLPRPAKA